MAAKKKLAVTPARSNTAVGNSPWRVRTRLNTKKIAPREPKKENNEITEKPSIAKFKFKAIAITAPRAAPLETPNVKGAAKSFLKRAWKIVPATDNAAPVKAPRRILGIRTWKRMLASTLLDVARVDENARARLMSLEPINGVMQRVTRNNKKNIERVVE